MLSGFHKNFPPTSIPTTKFFLNLFYLLEILEYFFSGTLMKIVIFFRDNEL